MQERSARVWVGGDGPAMLLIHGGWGGASHWARVWESLARQHRVVAPDLPGLGAVEASPLPTVESYARWSVSLLDALGIERAICVGNSFGGTVAWSLAGRLPERCDGLVLVNGIPMPRTPRPLRWLGHTDAGRALMRWGLRRFSYNPEMLARAFVDVSKAPAEMRALLADPAHPIVPRFTELLIEGDGGPSPLLRPLLLWGEDDQLAGTRLADARRLHEGLAGSDLRLIEGAGHFPQLEAPERFVGELEQWCAMRLTHNPGLGPRSSSPPRSGACVQRRRRLASATGESVVGSSATRARNRGAASASSRGARGAFPLRAKYEVGERAREGSRRDARDREIDLPRRATGSARGEPACVAKGQGERWR